MPQAKQFPWDVPGNAESIQELLFRIASLLYLGGVIESPANRTWGAFQQTVKGGGGFTSLQNFSAKNVFISNDSAAVMDVSQDGTNYYKLGSASVVGSGNTYVSINVKQSSSEILIRRHDGAVTDTTVSVLYFN